MPANRLAKMLEEHNVCNEAKVWAAAYATPSQAWLKCENPQWMIWALNSLGIFTERKARKFAVWCARNTPIGDGKTVWDLLTDERSRHAVEVAERHARGKATDVELNAAWSAAWSAADSVAWSAARSAASAAWSAASAAWSAAGSAAESAQADALRKIVGNPFKPTKRKRAKVK